MHKTQLLLAVVTYNLLAQIWVLSKSLSYNRKGLLAADATAT
jgi:hypothetical protein